MPADGPLELDDRIVWFKNGNIHREDGPAGFLSGDQELSARRAAERRKAHTSAVSAWGRGLQIDQILVWEQEKERERDIRFVDLGHYLCEVRAGQYWRLENLASFDEFLAKRFPESCHRQLKIPQYGRVVVEDQAGSVRRRDHDRLRFEAERFKRLLADEESRRR
jgi:hypothetical protein